MPETSQRLQNLPPYIFSVIGDTIRTMQSQGIDILRLDIGNPDLPPPPNVIKAGQESMQNPKNHGYTGYRGLAQFREAMSDYYSQRFNVTLDPTANVLPVIGSKEGIVNLSLAYLSPGDIALVPDIGYPSYSMGATLASGEVFFVPLSPENSFHPDIDAIPADIAARAKLFWVNYPNNPTGAVADVALYEKLIAFCRQHDILLVSDNPYMDVTFDGHIAPSALQAAGDNLNNVLEFYSFSKSYNMAGWRLGAALGDPTAIKDLLGIKSNVDSGHFKPVYEAGIEALNTPKTWLGERNGTYEARRDLILDALPDIGLEADKTFGSLYVWAKIKNGLSSTEYTEKARSEAHVSLAPGDAYGPGGAGYVRISIGIPTENITIALDKLKKWYQSL